MIVTGISIAHRNSTYKIQVLDRTFAIFDVIAANGPELTLAEITLRLNLHKSTAHRLLAVLEGYRYVERTRSGKYRLGSKLLELGARAAAGLDLAERALPFLRGLVAETGETAHVGILREGEVLSIANVESPRTLRTPATVGRRTPAHCTSLGKAILAFASEEQLAEVVRTRSLKGYTAKTLTRAEALRQELREVRRRGYAVDDEEFEEGLRCVGAPVRDHSGRVVAAVSITGPAFRITPERLPALGKSVIRAAEKLSAALGYGNCLSSNGRPKPEPARPRRERRS